MIFIVLNELKSSNSINKKERDEGPAKELLN